MPSRSNRLDDLRKRGAEARARLEYRADHPKEKPQRPKLSYVYDDFSPDMETPTEQMTPPAATQRANMNEQRLSGQRPVPITSVQPDFLKPQAVPGSFAAIQNFQESTPVPETKSANEQLGDRLKSVPVFGSVIKGLDWLSEKTKPAADVALEYYTPGAGLGALSAAEQAGAGLLQRFAPGVSKLGGRILTDASIGAVTGAGQSLAAHPEQGFKGAAFGAGEGAAGGAILPLAGKGVKYVADRTGLTNLLSRRLANAGVPEPEKATQELLALPLGREDAARARGINAPGTEPIVNQYTPEPLGLPSPRVDAPTTARVGRQTNPYRQKFENLIAEAQRRQADGLFTPGREDQDLESLWASMAGRDAPSLDELIQRAYRPAKEVSPDLVSRARQYQGAREVAGAPLPVKTAADRMAPQGPLAQAAPPVVRVGRKQVAPSVIKAETEQVPTLPKAQPKEAQALAAEAEADQIVKHVNEPRIRDKVYNFLDEQEAAARKRIAKRRGQLNSNPLPEWGDMSIIMAAKMGKGTIKLADFTEEAVKEFGESVRSKAPQLFKAAKEELQRNERLASKEGKAAEAFNNSGAGDANSFAEKINYKPAKKQSTLSQKTERIRSQFIDDLAALEGLEKRVKGKVSSAENSIYKTARLTKGIPERANQIVQQRLNPLISSVENAGHTADELGMYALARHAKDVNAAGFKSGFTNKEIDDVLNKHQNNPVLEEARKGLVQITRDMLQELADGGVISKELQSTLNNRWKNYIPLFRAFDDESLSGGRGSADKLANIASPVKKLTGSERDVVDPLENLVKNIFQSVNAAERNKVGLQLTDLAKRDTESKFIRKLGPDEEVGRKNVVNVKENGENVKYEVEPQVYKAMLSLDKESSNMIINILAQPASLLRSGATLTPEFSLRNPMRDVLQAFVTSKSGFNPLTDFVVGLGSTIKKGELYREWVDNLGAYGNVMSMDRNVHREALQKVLKEKPSKKFVNVVTGKSLINLLRYITDTTESATKVGEYRAALRQGQSKQEAAYRARDLMDFSRAGSGIRQANKMVAFLNANIQGKSRLIRAIKENPVGTITKSLASITVPTVGIYFWNHTHANETQKNTLEESPDWLKNSFWLIAVPGTDMVARIPKPFDLAPIFANLPERALQFYKEKDPKAFDGYAKSLLSSFAIPTQISGLLPLVEGMANYSFFREGSIIPQREDNVEYKDQYDPIRTTESAKLLAAGANKLTGGKGPFKNFSSPRIVDNTIQGLTAGLGTYATSAVDSLLQGKVFGEKLFPAIIDRPESPQKRLEQRPLVKSFLVDPLTNSRSLDKFYDEREKLTRENGSASLNDTKFGDSSRLKSLNKTSTRISKIGKQIREIEASKTLSPVEKRRRIEPLLTERNKLAKTAIEKG